MKKIMLIIIFLIPIFLILMVQLASVYIEKTHYIAVDRVSFPDSTYVIEKDTEDDVILEYEAKTILNKGKREGENLFARLINSLLDDGRNNDVALAAKDEEARKRFYREYGMIE